MCSSFVRVSPPSSTTRRWRRSCAGLRSRNSARRGPCLTARRCPMTCRSFLKRVPVAISCSESATSSAASSSRIIHRAGTWTNAPSQSASSWRSISSSQRRRLPCPPPARVVRTAVVSLLDYDAVPAGERNLAARGAPAHRHVNRVTPRRHVVRDNEEGGGAPGSGVQRSGPGLILCLRCVPGCRSAGIRRVRRCFDRSDRLHQKPSRYCDREHHLIEVGSQVAKLDGQPLAEDVRGGHPFRPANCHCKLVVA